MSRSTLSIPARDDRVLLAVEDDVSADLLLHRMTRRGIHPKQVEHGKAAAEELESTPFDLVIIEAQFPGLTGLELLKYMPSEEIAGNPQVILLGEGGDNEEVIRAFELGAAEYLKRPFAPEVALARIVRFLGKDRFVSRPPSASVLPVIPMPATTLSGGLSLFDLMSGLTAVFIVMALILALVAVVTHARAESRKRVRRKMEEKWKGLLLDVLADDKDPQDLVDQVPESKKRIFLEFLVPYAVTFEGRAQELLVHLAKPFLIHLEGDLEKRDPGTRARTLQLFGLLGDASCWGLLRKSLDDPSQTVAYTGFKWLARRGPPRAATPLLEHLHRFSGFSVNRISSTLVHLGTEAAPVLRSYLSDETQTPFVRVVCAETLRWIGDAQSAPVAAQLLVYEPHPELTAALLRLLRRVGQPEHAPLVRSYCNDDVDFVRIHAARALGQIGNPQDDRKLLRNLVMDTRSRWTAINAARSLKELDQTRPLHYLSRTNHEHASLATRVIKEPVR